MSSQPPPAVRDSLATASTSVSVPAVASASVPASASSASPQLSSSPHSSSTASTSDTVTCAAFAASSAAAPPATYSNDPSSAVQQQPVLNDTIDLTADTSLGHRHPPSSLEDHITSSLQAFSVPEAISSAADPDTAMIFSDFYKGSRSPLSRLRQQSPQSRNPANSPPWLAPEYEDLLSKDKYRQKDAIKRYLAAKVKTNWGWQWAPARKPEEKTAEKPSDSDEPRNSTTKDSEPEAIRVDSAKDMRDRTSEDAGYAVDSSDQGEDASDHEDIDAENDDDTDSVYSVVSEDAVNYRPRMDWYSDLSDDEAAITSLDKLEATDNVTKTSILEKRAARRRAAREEMTWNEGLACFEARRNAWTGAKTVRVRTKPVSSPPVSPRSPRRFFFRRSISGSPPSAALIDPNPLGNSPTGTISDISSMAKDEKDLKKQGSGDSDRVSDRLLPVETLLPIPYPILPPTNSFRASITPSLYLSLYDKVILNNLQPSCPINLQDMIRSCVTGWKRDGEWPPKPSAPEPIVVTMRRKKAKKASTTTGGSIGITARRLSFGLIGRDKDDEYHAGMGIRKSLQKVLGLGAPEGQNH
ncbi:hypothetical protein CFAM422_011969 [Trichoderma lentiforme]|uniref:Gag1-like clamp domain-containing protein n=1 Tax=Trichoderma lentiforme TaxID=1567552 RepID=A0A9P4X3L2_9HYPO|nr:hypothetical protein CFAM422_011969 [Trichoderma lentiforme]